MLGHHSDFSTAQQISGTFQSERAERAALTKCHLMLYTPNFLKLEVSQKYISYAALLHDYNTD